MQEVEPVFTPYSMFPGGVNIFFYPAGMHMNLYVQYVSLGRALGMCMWKRSFNLHNRIHGAWRRSLGNGFCLPSSIYVRTFLPLPFFPPSLSLSLSLSPSLALAAYFIIKAATYAAAAFELQQQRAPWASSSLRKYTKKGGKRKGGWKLTKKWVPWHCARANVHRMLDVILVM
jgi:hypothetical protein